MFSKKSVQYGKFDKNIAQKAEWEYVRSCNCLYVFHENFSRGPTIIIFSILPVLRRNITLKCIFES
jgi:hypothetical protein